MAIGPLLVSLRSVPSLTKEQRDQLPLILATIGPSIIPALVRHLHDPHEHVRAIVAAALGHLHALETVPSLAALARDPSDVVRQSVVEALGHARQHARGPARKTRGRTLGRGPSVEGRATWWFRRKKRRRTAYLPRDPVELAVATLESALDDDSAAVRTQAALALGRIGPAAAAVAPGLIGLLKEADETVRCQAAEALGEVGGEDGATVAALVELLQDASAPVKAAAARALGALKKGGRPGGPGAGAALAGPGGVGAHGGGRGHRAGRAAGSRPPPTPWSKGWPARTTWCAPRRPRPWGPSARPPRRPPRPWSRRWTTATTGCGPRPWRRWARSANRRRRPPFPVWSGTAGSRQLGQCPGGGSPGPDGGIGRRDFPPWSARSDISTRRCAATPPRRSARWARPPPSRDRRWNGGGRRGRRSPQPGHPCLGHDRQPHAASTQVVLAGLQDADPLVRAAAVESLGQWDEPSEAALIGLAPLLEDANDQVKVEVTKVLPKLAGATPAVIDGLCRRLLEDDSAWVQVHAALALGKLGPAAVAAGGPLLRAAQTGEVSVREQAMRAIAMIQPPETTQAFAAGLKDACGDIRMVASAGWMNAASIPEEAIPALVEALRDPEVQVRANAAHALARLDALPAAAVPLLIECTADCQRRPADERGEWR